MKNDKTFHGIAYIFLGAALLISGPTVQEQVQRLASDPNLQLAKAMYQSAFMNAVTSTKTEVLAMNTAEPPMQLETAAAPTTITAKGVEAPVTVVARAPEVPTIHVEVPTPKLKYVMFQDLAKRADFSGLSKTDFAQMNAEIRRANAEMVTALKKSAETRRMVMVRTTSEKCENEI